MGRHAPSSGEGWCRAQKLRRSADYLRCYRRGRRRHGALMSVHLHPNQAAEARLGITASRKVGGAVVRHRAKRRVREVFRRAPWRRRLVGLDVVVHLKPAAAGASFAAIRAELGRLLATADGAQAGAG